MNLATIEAIRQGIAEIAQQAETGWSGDDYNAGAAEMRRRIDNYLCELIAEHGGEVKEPEVFRYIEVRKIGAFAHNPATHREKAQEPGNMIMWMCRIKELEVQINSTAYFVTVCEYDSEQLLIDHFLEADKEFDKKVKNAKLLIDGFKYDKEPEPKIPWDELPEWVEFVAMDGDGRWFKFEHEPERINRLGVWGKTRQGQSGTAYNITVTAPDWRSSLRQRPAKTTEQC